MPFENDIRQVLSEKMFIEVASPDTDLLGTGLLDSLALIQLLVLRSSAEIGMDGAPRHARAILRLEDSIHIAVRNSP